MLTPTRAVVLIPPQSVWAPIQSIRRRYDRQMRRWMPHVTLLHPFRADDSRADTGPGVADALARACRTVEPFRLTLAEVRCFRHRHGNATLWLAPEPAAPLLALHAALLEAFPDCDRAARFPAGFTPHLSLGQARDGDELDERLAAVRDKLRPIRFEARRVSLIGRGEPPDDVFGVLEEYPLGGV